MFNEWCTIQSDPAVFTELIHRIGVPSAQVQEIYSLEDEDLLRRIAPIYGFIFLFKWTKETEPRKYLEVYDKQLFFANQVINNACATQAILSVLLNSGLPISGDLKDFQEFARELDSYDRGLALSNSQNIRNIHNSFSRPEPFVFKEDKKKSRKEKEAFHFVSYVPFKGDLYELDGLQKGPIKIGSFQDNDWISVAKTTILNRIMQYSQKEIRFTLLAICQDLKAKALASVAELERRKYSILTEFFPESPELATLVTTHKQYKFITFSQRERVSPTTHHQSGLASNKQEAEAVLREIEAQILDHQQTIKQEELKAERQQHQNIRRKHNYVPLILHLLKSAAKTNKLAEIVQHKIKF